VHEKFLRAFFKSQLYKTKKNNAITCPDPGRLAQIASRALLHCVHEKFLRAFFKSQLHKTKKNNAITCPDPGRLAQIASRALLHCVHEKFLRAFFKSQSQKTKKIMPSHVQILADWHKSPREHFCIVCMKNFCAHFSNLNLRKQKK
jgi:hypothetical protein